jgi:Protein of unknown function (DUF2470)
MANSPSPEVLESRIITHMNADHSASLRLYARQYSKLPLSHARTATLEDLNLNHLILSSSFGRTLVPFDPPLKTLSEARERLVAMHEYCLKELDVDGTMLQEYRLPNQWWQWTLMIVCGWCFTTLPFRSLIHPSSNSWISSVYSVGGKAPWLAEFAYTVAPLTLGIMLFVHGWEAMTMVRTRMRRYEVEMFSGVWWCWVLDCFVEGVGSFVRVDDTVLKIKEAKEKQPKNLGRGKH